MAAVRTKTERLCSRAAITHRRFERILSTESKRSLRILLICLTYLTIDQGCTQLFYISILDHLTKHWNKNLCRNMHFLTEIEWTDHYIQENFEHKTGCYTLLFLAKYHNNKKQEKQWWPRNASMQHRCRIFPCPYCSWGWRNNCWSLIYENDQRLQTNDRKRTSGTRGGAPDWWYSKYRVNEQQETPDVLLLWQHSLGLANTTRRTHTRQIHTKRYIIYRYTVYITKIKTVQYFVYFYKELRTLVNRVHNGKSSQTERSTKRYHGFPSKGKIL